MLDLIKKTMLAGIGATVTTKETIEAALHEYVEKGKLSGQEAKSLAERIAADGKEEFEQAKTDLSKRFHELIKKADVASRKEMAALEKRIAALEEHHHKPAKAHH
jgi:polyhydroxyalkanoate synthesis regulator phasin